MNHKEIEILHPKLGTVSDLLLSHLSYNTSKSMKATCIQRWKSIKDWSSDSFFFWLRSKGSKLSKWPPGRRWAQQRVAAGRMWLRYRSLCCSRSWSLCSWEWGRFPIQSGCRDVRLCSLRTRWPSPWCGLRLLTRAQGVGNKTGSYWANVMPTKAMLFNWG